MPVHISSTTAPLRWSARTTARPISTRDGRSASSARDVEFGCGVETSGGDRAGRRQHAVAADEFAGGVFTHQQVIAELVEPVGVQAVAAGRQGEARLGGEHLMAQPLGGLDERGVGGQQQGVAGCVQRRGLGRGYEYGRSAHSCTVTVAFGGMSTNA